MAVVKPRRRVAPVFGNYGSSRTTNHDDITLPGSSQLHMCVSALIEIDPMARLNRNHHIAVGAALILLVLLLLWGLPVG